MSKSPSMVAHRFSSLSEAQVLRPQPHCKLQLGGTWEPWAFGHLESQATSGPLLELQLEWAEVQAFAQPSRHCWGVEVPGQQVPLTNLVPTLAAPG